jgi:hypothetical protein
MNRSNIVDETAAVVERLRAAYTSWNNPPSDGLPDGAGVVLEAADLLERLSRERGTVPEGWRDISTAPKDGTSVLLFSSGEMVVARWDADYGFVDPEGAFVAPLSDGWDRAVKDHYSDPTHWMPLPAPPINAVPKPEGE